MYIKNFINLDVDVDDTFDVRKSLVELVNDLTINNLVDLIAYKKTNSKEFLEQLNSAYIDFSIDVDSSFSTDVSARKLSNQFTIEDLVAILKAKRYTLEDCFTLIIEHAEKDRATTAFVQSQNLSIIQSDQLTEFIKNLKQ